MDKQVRDKLQKYKEYIDWLDVYEGNLESNMGMSYEGISAKTNETNSDVENKVIQREKYYDEYKEKLEYVKTINKILNKLTDYERKIIVMKFNINDEDRFKKYMIGEVPDYEIYNSNKFYYERRMYYEIKKSAFRRFKELIKMVKL